MINFKETVITKSHLEALTFLQAHLCVAVPTETVYGLAADATSDEAVQSIYKAKGRPSFNPLIIHVDSMEMARKWGEFNDLAEELAHTYWSDHSPKKSPLTLVLKSINPILSKFVTAGLDTVAIRLPAHPVFRQLITSFGIPLAAPSANTSNYISPTTADAVFHDMNKRIPLILDGGPCNVGLESTIIDATGMLPVLLRPGTTIIETLASKAEKQNHVVAPGMLKRHYAPKIKLRMNATNKQLGEAFLGFGINPIADLNLSLSGDLKEAATNLFWMLRALDSDKYTGIAVAPIPEEGLGIAINDRLKRGTHS
jgi:L-threonylcarbamoyladenylate synthase